ncbi:MAG: U32 family peptidase [Clostridia bacterium]|nr:U32 family peptidase [Clostridia bacterium]
MNKPELLAPAGSMAALHAAIRYGADAVYVGGTMLQLRAKSAGFSLEEITEASEKLHACGKRLYVTVNALAKNEELDALKTYACELYARGVDAAIVSDLGVLVTMHRACPKLELHVSTQASCQNYACAQTYYELGAKRIVLAREMTVQDIAAMRKHIPDDLELEAFVHGAMCMAVSGRCIISSALVGRSGNRGDCAQPCRWNYHLVEETRPNQFFPIEEEAGTTAILSSRDLNAIELLDELYDAGVCSFKIEGRMKTEYYVSVVTNAYRHAIDRDVPLSLLQHELNTISHRPYTTGFYHGELPFDHANRGTYVQDYSFCGTVLSVDNGIATVEQRNRFARNDRLELVSPTSIGESFPVSEIYDESGNPVELANRVRQILKIPVPASVRAGDMLRKKNG